MASPLSSKIVPARGAAMRATASFSQFIDQDDDAEEDGDTGAHSEPVDGTLSSARAKGSNGTKRGPQRSTAPRSKKRNPSPLTVTDSSSELSDAPSPPVSRLLPHKPQSSVMPPFSTHPSKSSQHLTASYTWKRTALGRHVWVLVDAHGHVFEPSSPEKFNLQERIWWPAKVLTSSSSTTTSILLRPYGELTTSDLVDALRIQAPSIRNIQSIFDAETRAPRFLTFQAAIVSRVSSAYTSPRKKRKTQNSALSELAERWKAACQAIRDDMEGKTDTSNDDDGSSDDDDSPDVLRAALFAPSGSWGSPSGLIQKLKEKKGNAIKNDPIELVNGPPVSSRSWSPPSADEDLNIPDEGVYARSMDDDDKTFWPARILEYITPRDPLLVAQDRKRKGKSRRKKRKPTREEVEDMNGPYWLEFLDGSKEGVPRSWFYTFDQDEFATCALGQFESTFQDVQNDDEELEENLQLRRLREASPEVPASSTLSGDEFCELPLRSQFAHTKPVLRAIINAKYPPAQRTHDEYIMGGKRRRAVVDRAPARGSMDPADVAELRFWLTEWCVRDSGRAKVALQDVEEEDRMVENDQIAMDELRETPPAVTELATVTSSPSAATPSSCVAGVDCDIDNELAFPPAIPLSQVLPPSSQPEILDGPFVFNEDVEMTADHMQATDKIENKPLNAVSVSSRAGEESVIVPHPPSTQPHVVSTDMESVRFELGSTNNSDVDRVGASATDNTPACEATSQRPPRQRGCEGYEGLADLEKTDYCLNVLLPECILQILLWRSGLRTSTELLSPEEELAIHDVGEGKLKESDWVRDIERLRAMKRKVMRLDQGPLIQTAGTRSRPSARRAG